MRLCRPLRWFASFAWLLAVVPLASAVSVIPSEKEHVRSLDGTWRFKLEQGGDDPPRPGDSAKRPIKVPEKLEPFEKLDYVEDASWHDFTVPGNWEMAGYSPANYHQPDNAIGLFRLQFDVPAEWKGRVVKLNFDGVQNGAEVYLNGLPVTLDESSEGKPNFHQGGYNPFQADLTPAVKFGEKNLLAVRVYKNTKAVDMDSGDFFLMGGIHRSVTLFSVPQTRIEDFKVETRVLSDGKAEVKLLIDKAGPDAGSVSATIEGADVASNSISEEPRRVVITQVLDQPKLWSAEKPNLYALTIEMKNGAGKVTQRITRKIGVREVSIEGGVMMINHVPVKFTGICRHELWPTVGSALGPEQWRKEIELMKAANINSIRTSHYPYGSGFYDLCDEMGMYVADEMAAGWVPTDTDELTENFAQHAREYVRRDKNHPCVVIWAIGNENKDGKNNGVAAREIARLDSTRPRLVSQHDSKKLEGDVELDDRHYTPPDQIAKANGQTQRRKTIPMTYLENPNVWDVRNGTDWGSLDRWTAVIDRTWQVVWKSDHVPGSWLWEWQDRAVADKSPVKLWDFFPKTGINLVKVKGLVGAYRDVRPDYYAVKVAYAPVKVDLKPTVGDGAVTVKATNHLSFTDLSELATTWHLMRGGKDLKSETIRAKLAPRTSGDLKIDVPADALANADVLRLNFDYPDGRNMVTYDLRLKPEADTAPAMDVSGLKDVMFPRLNFVLANNQAKNSMWKEVVRHAGKLVNISVEKAEGGASEALKDDAALFAMPLAGVRSMKADLVLADDPSAQVFGRVEANIDRDGKFTYQVKWDAIPESAKPRTKERRTTDPEVQELGWIFTLPAGADHFSWHRKGYWSYYPADHIGRISGTATPDSSDGQDITRITRPDAFDFVSTKYDCDWAMLAGGDGGRGAGGGIVVKFGDDDRQHCRAGTAPDGRRELVVNKHACPPRDISTNVVPDYYVKGTSASGSFTIGASAPLR